MIAEDGMTHRHPASTTYNLLRSILTAELHRRNRTGRIEPTSRWATSPPVLLIATPVPGYSVIKKFVLHRDLHG